jgi:Glycosyl hydrolases family 39
MTHIKNVITKILILVLILASATISTKSSASNPIFEVNIDDKQIIQQINPQMYGINGFGALVLDWGKNPKYIENLKMMNPKNIRFHDNIQTDAVTNWRAFAYEDGKTWAKWKLNDFAEMIRLWRKNGINADITITIAHFPKWMKKYSPIHNGTRSTVELLDPSEFDNYADFLADLVKILNVDLKLGINKFEIGNELDSIYSVALQDGGFGRKMDELATIYHKASNKMKAIDSNIKVGGPCLTRADRFEGINEFIAKLKLLNNQNLDFFSYHTYVSGDNSTTDNFINERLTGNIKSFTRKIRSLLDSSGFTATPIILNEFNISWTDQTIDKRMTNQKGAVFDALAYIEATKEGITQIASWTDKDNVYGKMDDNYNRRPGSIALKMFSSLVKGSVIQSSHNIPHFSALPFRSNDKVGVALVNSSNLPINIQLKGLNVGNNSLTKYTISKEGKAMIKSNIKYQSKTTLSLEANSVVVLEGKSATQK